MAIQHSSGHGLAALVIAAAVGALPLARAQDRPGGTPPAPAITEAMRVELARTERRMREELGAGYRLERVRDLYVVATNGDAAMAQRARSTVEWVHDGMYRQFLSRRPSEPLLVYGFADAASYDAYVRRTYGRAPTTPYGFYMAGDRRLVMNLATGTGTLAHELVHPLLAADFPEVPAWFNEGFASLFEQSTTGRDGRMRGLPNWRLKGLQGAIRVGDCPSLRDVMRTTTGEFYGERSGAHYAVARYLCYWLQEHGALESFLRDFRATAEREPTGVEALERTIGVPLPDFEPRWVEYVKGLRFGG